MKMPQERTGSKPAPKGAISSKQYRAKAGAGQTHSQTVLQPPALPTDWTERQHAGLPKLLLSYRQGVAWGRSRACSHAPATRLTLANAA